MKKGKNFRLRTLTDIKVFLLFLLEKIAYPIDKTTLIRIIAENTYMLSFEYDVAFRNWWTTDICTAIRWTARPIT